MELINNKGYTKLPNRENVIQFLNDTRKYIFPGYFEELNTNAIEYKKILKEKLEKEFLSTIEANEKKKEFFFNELPQLEEILKTDIEMTYQSDPACESIEEIILTYPGIFAISVYRIAHILYNLEIPIIPRIMTEFAHSKTGIDIHPGATIGPYFFIDHGTGIVIGETSVIQDHVKIYHGVTLGALSLKKGQSLKGKKRHPSIGSYVTIYSGASILGGDTHIGDRSTLGSNVFLVSSVPNDSKVVLNVSIETNSKNK